MTPKRKAIDLIETKLVELVDGYWADGLNLDDPKAVSEHNEVTRHLNDFLERHQKRYHLND